MKKTLAIALVLALALPARAADPVPPPPPPPDEESPPPEDVPPPPPSAQQFGYFDRCFGPGRSGGQVGVGGQVIVPIGGGHHHTSPEISLPSGSGSGDDRAWVVVAVLAAAALPVVIYAIDEPAPRVVLHRFECPTFSLDLLGGADTGRAAGTDGSYGFVSTRVGMYASHAGFDFQFDGLAAGGSSYSTHLLLRVTPKAHVEGALALGYRHTLLNGRLQDGFEIGLPHQYALSRDGLRTVGLELRPMLMLGQSVEPSLEAALLLPLGESFQFRFGGRIYTFDGDLLWGLGLGCSLNVF